MKLDLLQIINGITGNIMSVCAISAVLNLLVRDDGSSFGFRMACNIGISLIIIRGIMGIF